MGHSFSSTEFDNKYSNSLTLQKVIDNDLWYSVIIENSDTSKVKDIDLSGQNMDKHKYIIKVDSEIPSNCNMTLFFPTHTDSNKRVLHTKDYLGHINTFNKEINERIQNSNRTNKDIPLLCISSSEHFYRFYNFLGNIYFLWAETLNIESTENDLLEQQILKHVPFIVETDGYATFKSMYIFPLPNNIPISNITQFLDNASWDLFCCESDPRYKSLSSNTNKTTFKSITLSTADDICNTIVKPTVKELNDDDEPFFNNNNLEEPLLLK